MALYRIFWANKMKQLSKKSKDRLNGLKPPKKCMIFCFVFIFLVQLDLLEKKIILFLKIFLFFFCYWTNPSPPSVSASLSR